MQNFDCVLDAEGVTAKTILGHAFRVAGVTFTREYPENLYALKLVMEQAEVEGSNEGITVLLLRNPDNPQDSNAIGVEVPGIGRIGHVPRSIAADLAPRMDAGERFQAAIVAVRIREGHEDRPGITVNYEPVKEPQ
jgi:hypothetical protein